MRSDFCAAGRKRRFDFYFSYTSSEFAKSALVRSPLHFMIAGWYSWIRPKNRQPPCVLTGAHKHNLSFLIRGRHYTHWRVL